jgi:regulator of replication initiation timing
VHAKLCLIASHHSNNEVNSSSTSDYENDDHAIPYNQLYDTCLELFEKSKTYAKQLSNMKKDLKIKDDSIVGLKNILESFKIENNFLKSNDSTMREELKNINDNFEKLKVEHEKLKKTFSKFDVGSNSLSRLLGSQISPSCKFGIGFHASQEIGTDLKYSLQKSIEKDSNKVPQTSNLYACKHCKMTNHRMHNCFVKFKGLPKGKYVWVAKGTIPRTNKKGPNITWVPSSSH